MTRKIKSSKLVEHSCPATYCSINHRRSVGCEIIALTLSKKNNLNTRNIKQKGKKSELTGPTLTSSLVKFNSFSFTF